MINTVCMALLSGSVGIIGGADGPTTIFVTPGKDWYIGPAVLAAVVLCVILLIRRRRKR